ncbi:zinc finger protein 497 [Helicoverpa armigera]|uniref:zinc finger protein 497 n=1 Tax=Helicoverpa armigera TaxID=29058 RepID=UPI000B369D11|nr:zinc finger protein 497-like [Helicoverpa armigera]XP_047035454.1 zinc finger protein 497-like [Helicoverpa zea]
MEDSYIIANFHTLCRLCLNKSTFSTSIFAAAPDDETNVSLTSKLAECFELQIDPNDGMPNRICYKCLFKVDKCSKFKLQCIQNETRLRQITTRVNELDNSNSSELSSYNYGSHSQDGQKPKPEDYIVEDSVVMVVDPSLDYDSSEESENMDPVEPEVVERNNTPDGEPMAESFFKNVFMCQFCDQAFVSQEKCKEHEHNCHDPNLPYRCVECSLVFAERSQYVQHTKQVHGNDKPYHCPECDKCFGRRSDLRKHSIVHTGIRPYQCQYCLKSFSRNTNLSKHLRIHAGHKPHVCPLCPRSFVAKGDLQRHVLVHSGMKPFACRKCPLTFGRRDKLIKHEMRHGPMSPNKTNDFDNEHDSHDMVVNVNPFSNLMTSPTQLHPDSSNTEYDLPRVPDHISGESSFMKVQKNTSASNKPAQHSPSKQKAAANKNRPKNIKCHQCPKRFSSLDSYKTHVSIAHIGSRVFQCKICFKKFPRKRELDRHAALHSGMKPFSCNQCDKKFTKKDKLDKHEQTHECLVVNMPCIECGATFEKKADLVAHIKSHFTENFDDKMTEAEIKKEEDPEFNLDDNFYDLET